MFKRLIDWHCKRLRRIDVDMLWPACRENAPSLPSARAAFLLHAGQSRAWLRLGYDEIIRQVENLH